MNEAVLRGVSGANPLGFLASIGLLRVLSAGTPDTRLSFRTDGSFHPVIHGPVVDVAGVVADDALRDADESSWLVTYDKIEKKGVKKVADLKAPPDQFSAFLARSIDQWVRGDERAAAYGAAFGTSVARDGKGNTKPTAFHFTAANQQFLDSVRAIRRMVDREWVQHALFEGADERPGTNVRWDPAADRSWALMAENPITGGTRVNAPLEWLAFRGLPLLPSVPRGTRIFTTGVSGRGDEMKWTWPVWSLPASVQTVRSILGVDWSDRRTRTLRGIDIVCSSPIRRSSQGFGNFAPALVQA